jgi:HlyD family secretion protein
MQQMSSPAVVVRKNSMARTLALILGLASMGLAGFAVSLMVTPGQAVPKVQLPGLGPSPSKTQAAGASSQLPWIAAAPGRVEPRSGLIKISAQAMGRVVSVPARQNDKVAEGQVLIQLEDKEARARLTAAEAEAAARKRERDAQPASSRDSVNRAEDALFSAERAVASARFELDDAIVSDQKGGNQQSAARRRLSDAQERLRQETSNFASAVSRANNPAPNRIESAVAAARADVTLAENALDKTRIRAPVGGTLLQLHAKVGESLAPSELPVVVMGDMSKLRVRAEVDEQDVGKIRVGQSAYVKNTAYPGQEFEGKVAELAPSLAIPRMGARGPRRATDVEVLEVVIDLDGSVPLLPGMRVDAFFR